MFVQFVQCDNSEEMSVLDVNYFICVIIQAIINQMHAMRTRLSVQHLIPKPFYLTD